MKLFCIRFKRYIDKETYTINDFFVYDEKEESAKERFLSATGADETQIIKIMEV